MVLFLFSVVVALSFWDNRRFPGRIHPLQIEYMGMKFNSRRMMLSLIASVLLMVLSIVFNPGASWDIPYLLRLLYFAFTVFCVGVIIFTIDQLFFLAAIFGVVLSNAGKDSEGQDSYGR